ncbi:MAG TPA: beta-ketoacyl synthase N-terminal-like domain-containing protein [Tepidisphaeraceae bacterium]
MLQPSFIEGIGLVTAQGVGAEHSWNALLNHQTLSDHGGAALARNKQSRVVQLAALAAREAIADAAWDHDLLSNSRTALIVGTSKGPIDEWIAAQETAVQFQLLGGISQLANDLAADLGMCGPRQTWSAACASGLHALWQAQNLIRRGVCDRALVVAAESSLHPLFVASFGRLGVLAKPGYGCRPFDKQRNGFTLSEAAAAVCLSGVRKRATIQLDRVAIASDAHHITGIDPAGEALRHVLKTAAANQPVDFVHAHGTATITNDPVELLAIESVIGAHRPHVFSHKAAFGHTQGAAGLIGVICNVLTHRYRTVPPNAGTEDPIEHQDVVLSQNVTSRRVHRSLVLAAGFGGPLACAALSGSDEA